MEYQFHRLLFGPKPTDAELRFAWTQAGQLANDLHRLADALAREAKEGPSKYVTEAFTTEDGLPGWRAPARTGDAPFPDSADLLTQLRGRDAACPRGAVADLNSAMDLAAAVANATRHEAGALGAEAKAAALALRGAAEKIAREVLSPSVPDRTPDPEKKLCDPPAEVIAAANFIRRGWKDADSAKRKRPRRIELVRDFLCDRKDIDTEPENFDKNFQPSKYGYLLGK